MKTFFLVLTFFFLFGLPAFAQEIPVLPSKPSVVYPEGYNIPGYCIFRQEILGPDDNVYLCVDVASFVYSQQTRTDDHLYHNCWQSFQNNTNSFGSKSSGVPLRKDLSISFSLPAGYNTCVLKSVSEDGLCESPIDVDSLVRSAFGQRFPLDLFQGFNPPSGVLSCPVLTVFDQSFQLCYLKDLVGSLKYVILIVFIISSVMSL
jgi:hypothetical protein